MRGEGKGSPGRFSGESSARSMHLRLTTTASPGSLAAEEGRTGLSKVR
jgi:hypothetical protein